MFKLTFEVSCQSIIMFIVTKEIDSENIGKLCRTCLREDGDKMVCLFVGPAESSLAAKLRSLSCLEVINIFKFAIFLLARIRNLILLRLKCVFH